MHQSLRSLWKAPGFTFLAVLTMALGIGATTALFSVVDAVIIKPLPFPSVDRIVALNTAWPSKTRVSPRVTGGDVMDLRSTVKSFAQIAVYAGGEIGVRLRNQARFAGTFQVDPFFFSALHVQASAGRLPGLQDAEHTAVVTESFARANWPAPSAALGETLTVDNKPYQIIGLLPDRYAFPAKADLWITGPLTPESQNRSAFNYKAIASLRPGVTLVQAQAELANLSEVLRKEHSESDKDRVFRVIPLQDQLVSPIKTTLLFLFGAAALLLLISCSNVANLMLARSSTRTREVAVRLSLGSGSAGILRLLLSEGLFIGLAASLSGLLIAWLALRFSFPLIPASVPNAAAALHLNPEILVFAAALSCLTVFACSLIPAFHLRRLDLFEALKQSSGRTVSGGAARSRHVIVIAQVAVCSVLCVGAVMLSRTLLALLDTPLGFRTEGVLVMYADAPAFELPQYLEAIRTFETALDQIREIPGVKAAAAIMGLPAGRYGSNGGYLVEGVHIQPGQDPFKMNWPANVPEATFAVASQNYFSTVGIRLIAGRDFTPRDRYDAPFTAIISQSLARQSFGNTDPIGRRIYCGLDSPQPMTIVGVVSDVRQDSPASKPEPEIYMPFQQHPYHANELEIAIRTEGDPSRFAPEVRRRMAHLAPYIATNFTTFRDIISDSIAAPRFRAALILAFAVLAVLLAMSGIYAVMTYWVSERTAEMGLRMALGADRLRIISFVSRQALLLAVTGIFAGIAAALALSRFAESLIYGFHALDPLTYICGAAIVLATVLAAALLPSLRASFIDPATALRDN